MCQYIKLAANGFSFVHVDSKNSLMKLGSISEFSLDAELDILVLGKLQLDWYSVRF